MELFACSGHGAGAYIARRILIGNVHAGVFGFLLLTSTAVAVKWKVYSTVPFLLTLMLALHPAWTISALSGDCGETKRAFSWLLSAVGTIAIVWQIVWARQVYRARTHLPRPSAYSFPPDNPISLAGDQNELSSFCERNKWRR